MGCIGMSYGDFCLCTPSEFTAVAEQWGKKAEADYRTGWDRARTIAVAALQPYSKKELKMTDILLFTWDKEEERDTRTGTSNREMFEKLVMEREKQRLAEKDG